ncbi:MAG: FemAB family protein [Winogradskyella sp.]|uniref:FemAB family protein n=1 Tax=Winogradskyella sp. TaxID=1883156 RepID=UPI00385C3A85
MIYKNDNLVVLLPANISKNILFSHQGLTYGGFIMCKELNTLEVDEIFKSLFQFLKSEEINYLELKLLPHFYKKNPTNIVSDYLVSINADKFRTDMVLAIDYSAALHIHKTKLKHFRRNTNRGFEIKEESSLDIFWNKVLIPRLKEKHNTVPVHSLKEIMSLKSIFPNQIRQFNIYLDGKILAGITIFDKGSVVKSQYGATTIAGQHERALEFLFIHLINKFKEEGKTFFSMGTVRDTSKSEGYNEGLLKQKQELGCTVFYQNFYKIDVI